MRDNIQDFVYLNTQNYISLNSLKIFYWAIIIVPFMMVVMGVVGKSLFILTFVALWSSLYWMFVLLLQSKHVKKTFELRFVVNGVTGLFVSSLFWGLYTAFNLVSDTSFLTFDYFLQIIIFYIFFIILYTAVIIFGINKGVYGRIKKNNSVFRIITKTLTVILPGAGVYGMYTSRLLRTYGQVSVQTGIATTCFILLIFLPGLAHINFVQYFYCKKYRITCDETGDTTSPQLVPKVKNRIIKNRSRKKFSLSFKILTCISCISILMFVLLLIIGIFINL